MHLKIKLIIKISRNLKYNYSTLHSLAPLEERFCKKQGGQDYAKSEFYRFLEKFKYKLS